jgi:hypothetical protein
VPGTTKARDCNHEVFPGVGDCVYRESSLPTRPEWNRKAAAHAEIFRLLGEIAGGRAAGKPGVKAAAVRDLMTAVGQRPTG